MCPFVTGSFTWGKIGHSSEKVSPDYRVSPRHSVPWRQVLLYHIKYRVNQTVKPVFRAPPYPTWQVFLDHRLDYMAKARPAISHQCSLNTDFTVIQYRVWSSYLVKLGFQRTLINLSFYKNNSAIKLAWKMTSMFLIVLKL